MKTFQTHQTLIAYQSVGHDFMESLPEDDKPLILWAHGWGQSHHSFTPLITPFETSANNIAIDLPGFGDSAPPPQVWGTEDYADAIATIMKERKIPPVLWIGHSFGCRVGLQMAANYPECISGLCLIAGAGLKRKRSPLKKIYLFLRIKLFKFLKKVVPDGALKQKLMAKFGSPDYKTAGSMRGVFIKAVNEDLSEIAKSITCPVTLVYGANDTETPPEFGQRYAKLIPNSTLFVLGGQDHYSVLSTGRHQVIKIIGDILKQK